MVTVSLPPFKKGYISHWICTFYFAGEKQVQVVAMIIPERILGFDVSAKLDADVSGNFKTRNTAKTQPEVHHYPEHRFTSRFFEESSQNSDPQPEVNATDSPEMGDHNQCFQDTCGHVPETEKYSTGVFSAEAQAEFGHPVVHQESYDVTDSLEPLTYSPTQIVTASDVAIDDNVHQSNEPNLLRKEESENAMQIIKQQDQQRRVLRDITNLPQEQRKYGKSISTDKTETQVDSVSIGKFKQPVNQPSALALECKKLQASQAKESAHKQSGVGDGSDEQPIMLSSQDTDSMKGEFPLYYCMPQWHKIQEILHVFLIPRSCQIILQARAFNQRCYKLCASFIFSVCLIPDRVPIDTWLKTDGSEDRRKASHWNIIHREALSTS